MNKNQIRKLAELRVFKKLILDNPSGIISIVADTFDFFNVINVIAPSLKEEILARTLNEIGLAKVVFRPDSGDPVEILCGKPFIDMSEYDKLSDDEFQADFYVHDDFGILLRKGQYYEYTNYIGDGYNTEVDYENPVPIPEMKGAVEVLWDHFGGTLTPKGFKVLNERVGLIYGDSITLDRAYAILSRLAAKGFASCNVVLGIGSFTYQYSTRDTYGFAMKATYGVINGQGVEIFKDPATDKGKVKKSAKGLLRVEKENGKFVLYDQQTPEQEQGGLLQSVFKDGEFYNFQNWDQVRTLARQ